MYLRDNLANNYHCATGALGHFKHFEGDLVKGGVTTHPHPDMTGTMIEYAHTNVSNVSTS